MTPFLDRMSPKMQTYRSLVVTYWANANAEDWHVQEWLNEFLEDCSCFGFDPANYPSNNPRIRTV